jgi:hypothetical protein
MRWKRRGLLCRRCNSYIGLWGNDVELLRRAASYLEGIDGYGCEISVVQNRKDVNKKGILSSIEGRAKALKSGEKQHEEH